MKHFCVALLMMFGAACAESADQGAPVADLESLRTELMEEDRAFASATGERGVDGWLAYFEPGGVMILGSGEIRGDDAIRSLMGPLLADSTIAFGWTPVRAEVARSGDFGYTVGNYAIRPADDDDAEPLSYGMYLTVWRRQEDGSWKVTADIGNPASE